MLRLGGALCTFALDSHPRTLPLYDHDNLDECFGLLDEHIRRHLETIVPTQYITIPLTKPPIISIPAKSRISAAWGPRAGFSASDLTVGEVEIISRTPQGRENLLGGVCAAACEERAARDGTDALPVAPSAIPAQSRLSVFQCQQGRPLLGPYRANAPYRRVRAG